MAQQNFQDYDPLDDYARRTNSVREKLSFLITRVSVPFALVTQCISESLLILLNLSHLNIAMTGICFYVSFLLISKALVYHTGFNINRKGIKIIFT